MILKEENQKFSRIYSTEFSHNECPNLRKVTTSCIRNHLKIWLSKQGSKSEKEKHPKAA